MRQLTGTLSFGVLLASQLAATTGFMFVMPFLPLYVQRLGVEDAGHAAAWAGLLNTATAVTMALAAPSWGRLGDRYGQKKMLLRATLARQDWGRAVVQISHTSELHLLASCMCWKG